MEQFEVHRAAGAVHRSDQVAHQRAAQHAGAAARGLHAEAVAVAVGDAARRPGEAVHAAAQRAELERAGDMAGSVQHLDAHVVGRPVELEAADAVAGQHRQPVARHGDLAADQAHALQRLQLHQLAVQSGHGGIQLLDAADGVDLRQLAGHLRVVERVQRVLVGHLRDEQLQEAVLGAGLVLRLRLASRRRALHRVDRVHD